MKRIVVLFSVWFIFGVVATGKAQESKGAMRLEVPANLDLQRYHLIPLQKRGFLIFYESKEVSNEGKRKWFFGFMDTHLRQKWLKYLPLTDKLLYVDYKQKKNLLVLVFQNTVKVRSDYGFYEIVTFDVNREKFTHVAGTMPLKARIKAFDFYYKTACLAMNINNDKADLLFVNLNNGNVQPVHLKGGAVRIESLFYNPVSARFDLFVKRFNGKVYDKDIFIQYGVSGEKLGETIIQTGSSVRIPAYYTAAVKADSLMLYFGTYSLITASNFKLSDYNKNNEHQTAGFFVFTHRPNGKTVLRFYDFLSFKNITGTFANRTYKLKKQNNGKANKPLASLLFTGKPQLVSFKDHYVLSAEAFKPSYRTETRMDYDFYGRPYPYTYEVFDGYEVYDLILSGFSKTGDYIWDNDFPISGIDTYTLNRRTLVRAVDDYLIAAYVSGGIIYAQWIDGASDIGGVEKVKVAPKFVRDKVVESENEHIVYWYDNCYLVYGYQKLTNRTLKDQNYRSVFYVNKVVFQ